MSKHAEGKSELRRLLGALRPYARHQPDCAYLRCVLRAAREPSAMAAMACDGYPPCSCGFEGLLRRLSADVWVDPATWTAEEGAVQVVLSEAVGRPVVLSEAEAERLLVALSFIQNRLDGVAMDVVSWMPPEDNERHHNAVEMLLRAHQTAADLVELLAQRSGSRAYPTPGNLERIAEEVDLAARFLRQQRERRSPA